MFRQTARNSRRAQSTSLQFDTLEDRCVLSRLGALDSVSQLLAPLQSVPALSASADLKEQGNGSSLHAAASGQESGADQGNGTGLGLSLLQETLALKPNQDGAQVSSSVAKAGGNGGLFGGLLHALEAQADRVESSAADGEDTQGHHAVEKTTRTRRQPLLEVTVSVQVELPVASDETPQAGDGQQSPPAASTTVADGVPVDFSLTLPRGAAEQAGKVGTAAPAAPAARVGPLLVDGPLDPVREVTLNLGPQALQGRLASEVERAVARALRTASAEDGGQTEAVAAQPPVAFIKVSADQSQGVLTAPAPLGNLAAASPPPVVVDAGARAPGLVSSALASLDGRLNYLPIAWVWRVATDAGSVEYFRSSQAWEDREAVGAPSPGLPSSAGLVAGAAPADTAALQRALEEFLGQLDGAGREVTRALSESSWASWAVALALAVAALELGRRRVRRGRRDDFGDEADGAALSWASGSWSFEAEER
jgi:hypothetical protein